MANEKEKIAAEKLIINAEGAIYGRLASFAAKEALQGKEVIILNSDKTIITGNRRNIQERYRDLKNKGGNSQKGPNYAKPVIKMLRRSIRGMLPNYREGVGRQAYKRVMCYEGIPKEFEKEKIIKIKTPEKNKFMTLKEVSDSL